MGPAGGGEGATEGSDGEREGGDAAAPGRIHDLRGPVTGHRRVVEFAALGEEEECPDHGQQAVGNGVMGKVQRRNGGGPRRNHDPFEPHKEQGRPEQIDELAREEEGAEGDARREGFGPKSDGKVAEKHEFERDEGDA